MNEKFLICSTAGPGLLREQRKINKLKQVPLCFAETFLLNIKG